MRNTKAAPMSTRARLVSISSCAAAWALLLATTGAQPAGAAEAPVGLGTATSYAVLASSTVTSTGASVVNGDLGLSPGTAVVGFGPADDGTLNGDLHVADAEALQAQADLTVAYDDAAGRGPGTAVATELGGLTFEPGVYTGGTLGITGTVTLDAGNVAGAVFVFQAATTLTTAVDSDVVLINGADPCNVYWQVGSSATLLTGTDLTGTILAEESITTQTGTTVQGRLLARFAAVTLDTTTITAPTCDVLPPGSTTTTTLPATTSTVDPGSTTTEPGATTTTADPGTPTTQPGTTTTTADPGTTTTQPATTTTTADPGTTTTQPGTTTSQPVTTTSQPGTTTTTADPGTTTTVAASTTTAPGSITTQVEATTTTAPGTATTVVVDGTTTVPATTTTTEAATTVQGGSRGPGGSTSRELARTGSSLGPLAAFGGTVLGLGAVILVLRRRLLA